MTAEVEKIDCFSIHHPRVNAIKPSSIHGWWIRQKIFITQSRCISWCLFWSVAIFCITNFHIKRVSSFFCRGSPVSYCVATTDLLLWQYNSFTVINWPLFSANDEKAVWSCESCAQPQPICDRSELVSLKVFWTASLSYSHIMYSFHPVGQLIYCIINNQSMKLFCNKYCGQFHSSEEVTGFRIHQYAL